MTGTGGGRANMSVAHETFLFYVPYSMCNWGPRFATQLNVAWPNKSCMGLRVAFCDKTQFCLIPIVRAPLAQFIQIKQKSG